MDISVYNYLTENPRLLRFVRYNPEWYRYLARDPGKMNELEKAAKVFYGQTFPQRVEKWNHQIQMIEMLLQFAGAMKD